MRNAKDKELREMILKEDAAQGKPKMESPVIEIITLAACDMVFTSPQFTMQYDEIETTN